MQYWNRNECCSVAKRTRKLCEILYYNIIALEIFIGRHSQHHTALTAHFDARSTLDLIEKSQQAERESAQLALICLCLKAYMKMDMPPHSMRSRLEHFLMFMYASKQYWPGS